MSSQFVSQGHLLTPAQVAERLNIKVATLAVWRSSNKYYFPYVKIGSRVMYRAEDVSSFVNDHVHIHTAKKL